MKQIIVACGTGIATSQTVASRVKKMLEDKGHYVNVAAIDIAMLESEAKSADIYISITPNTNPKNLGIPIFDGIPILTGIGADEEINKIIKSLKG